MFDPERRLGLTPDSAAYYGDALLLRMGVTLVFLGWQSDVPPGPTLLHFYPPVASSHGRTITGLVRSDWTIDAPTYALPLGHHVGRSEAVPYPVAEPDDSANVLTERDAPLAPRHVVPRTRWRFAREDSGRVVDDRRWVYMAAGFTPGRIYELVYRAREPVVVGTGLAAVRDMISFLKYDPGTIAPTRYGLAYGVSQTGRFLRHFLYQGFNTDEHGRTAFDGMFVHTAGGGRGSFNHRFAQPSRDAQPYTTFFYPTDVFPFTSRRECDPAAPRCDGLLTHTGTEAPHLPKIFYVEGGYEYWGRVASLTHTSPDARHDATYLPNERRYVIASAQHSGPSAFPPDPGAHIPGSPAYRGNPLELRWPVRALFVALVDWVKDGTPPPPSRYPTIAAGTLVTPEAVRFPHIPDVPTAHVPAAAYHLDFGPRWSQGIVDVEPPRVGPPYPILVPQVDSLGNDRGGIGTMETLVPVATYFPWQLRTDAPAATDRLRSFAGTVVPLPRTETERRTHDDPRPSVERLYGTKTAYLVQARAVTARLVAERTLLPDDVPAVMRRAEALWEWVMAASR
jgi:hypothetical protein